MPKKSIIFILGFLIVIAGSISALSIYKPGDKNSTSPNPSSQSQSNSTSASNDSATEIKETYGGEYLNYDEQKLASAKGTRVLFFHAPWCSQCRSIEQGISTDTIPSDVSIFKVDYDTNTELKKKYGVTLQTTFVVIDENDNLIKKHVAYSEPTFDAVKKALF